MLVAQRASKTMVWFAACAYVRPAVLAGRALQQAAVHSGNWLAEETGALRGGALLHPAGQPTCRVSFFSKPSAATHALCCASRARCGISAEGSSPEVARARAREAAAGLGSGAA